MDHLNQLAAAALDELEKTAAPKSFTGAAVRGAAIGAGVGASYGALRGALRERRKRTSRRRYGRAALEGAMDAAPKAMSVGAGLGFARHGWKTTERNINELKGDMRDVMQEGKRTAQRIGHTADETAKAIQTTSKDVSALRQSTDKVLGPIGDSIQAMKSEGVERAKTKKPGLVARFFRRKAGDVLAKGSRGK